MCHFVTCLYIFVFEHIDIHGCGIVAQIQIVAILMLPYLMDILEAGKIVNSVHGTLLQLL